MRAIVLSSLIVLLIAFAAITPLRSQPAASPSNPPLAPPTPIEASDLAAAQYQLIVKAGLDPHFIRWIWLNHPNAEQRISTLITLNSVVNQSSLPYVTPFVESTDGRVVLLPVDFTRLADTIEDRDRILSEWDSLGTDDAYFHAHLSVQEQIVKTPASKDGKQKAVFETRSSQFIVPAPYLKNSGVYTNTVIGCVFDEKTKHWNSTLCPLIRADQFIQLATESKNHGHYLRFRGLTPGKTHFGDYLASRGASLDVAVKRHADERAGLLSRVTGNARAITAFYGQGVRPTTGIPIVFITEDISEDNQDPNSDPFLSLLNPEVDAMEVFLTLPNGSIETTLWTRVKDSSSTKSNIQSDPSSSKSQTSLSTTRTHVGINDAILLAEAPPDVVADRKNPDPHTTRLNGFVSCVRCHADQEIIMPYRNEVRDAFASFLRPQVDISRGFDPASIAGQKTLFEQYQSLQFKYAADQDSLDELLYSARTGWDRFAFSVLAPLGLVDPNETHAGSKAATAVGSSYNRYIAWVDPLTADEELGLPVDRADPLGINTFRNGVPAVDPTGAILQASASIQGRLGTSWLETKPAIDKAPPQKIQRSLSVTRSQWESSYPEIMLRRVGQ